LLIKPRLRLETADIAVFGSYIAVILRIPVNGDSTGVSSALSLLPGIKVIGVNPATPAKAGSASAQ
jgi:hypothetical protein